LWTINMGQSLLSAGIRQQTAPLDAAQIADFQLFPNPAGEVLNVDLTQWIGKTGKLIFINQLGKVVFEKTFENIQTPIETMDLSGFNNGQYFVKMETAGQRTLVKRLVVSRMY
jgi:Secretion system C-terminal sorting domain